MVLKIANASISFLKVFLLLVISKPGDFVSLSKNIYLDLIDFGNSYFELIHQPNKFTAFIIFDLFLIICNFYFTEFWATIFVISYKNTADVFFIDDFFLDN